QPETVPEATATIQALTYYAWTTTDAGQRQQALDRAQGVADALLDMETPTVEAKAAAIRGLIEVGRLGDGDKYVQPAVALFQQLSDDFDPAHGIFNSKNAYNVDDVAWIIDGLNAMVLHGPAAQLQPASAMLLAFFEALMDQSGLQLSAPPGKNGAMASDFERNLPSVVYYHGADTPPPPAAGGTSGLGIAPVVATEVTWDGSAWQVTDPRFTTEGGMHLANVINWMGPHLGSVGFPPLSLQ
ncbi:MAG: hypothetical protein ACE5IZ_11325, partial [Dehalococcoidia bacterium]